MNSDLAIFAVGLAVTVITFAGVAITVVDRYHLTLDMLRERRRARRSGNRRDDGRTVRA